MLKLQFVFKTVSRSVQDKYKVKGFALQSSNASAISNNAIRSIAIRKERISNASKISYLQLGEIFESGEGNRPVPEKSCFFLEDAMIFFKRENKTIQRAR